MNSSESPGRKKPISSPVSAKMIEHDEELAERRHRLDHVSWGRAATQERKVKHGRTVDLAPGVLGGAERTTWLDSADVAWHHFRSRCAAFGRRDDSAGTGRLTGRIPEVPERGPSHS